MPANVCSHVHVGKGYSHRVPTDLEKSLNFTLLLEFKIGPFVLELTWNMHICP